jgi:hypothetical protein
MDTIPSPCDTCALEKIDSERCLICHKLDRRYYRRRRPRSERAYEDSTRTRR